MDDALLLNRAIGGDLDSLGQLFDSYFGRVYDFAWRMLRDAGAASAATEAIFRETAANLRSAAKASSFEAWLFSLAHARLMSRVPLGGAPMTTGPQHEEAFGAFEAPDPCRVDNRELAGADPDLPCEVWEAAASLSPRDYSLLDLHRRQHLDPRDLAPILGGSRGNAAIMLERLEHAASEVIATYVLAKRGPAECEELRHIVTAGGFPPLTNELRTQIDGHAATCDICRRTRTLRVPPLEIFAALLPVTAPFVLKGEVWRALAAEARDDARDLPLGVPLPVAIGVPAYASTSMPTLESFGSGEGSGGGGYDDSGATGFLGDESRRNVLLFAGAAAGMLLVAFIAGAFALKAFGSGGGSGRGAALTATRTAAAGTATPRTTLTPGVVIDTPTPASATPTPLPTDTPLPPPPDTPTPPPPPPPPTVPPTRTPPKQASPTPLRPTPTPTKKPVR